MTVAELIAKLGFSVDNQSLKGAEKAVTGLRGFAQKAFKKPEKIQTNVDQSSIDAAEQAILGLKSFAQKAIGVIGIGFSVAGLKGAVETSAEFEATNAQFEQTFKQKDDTGAVTEDYTAQALESVQAVADKNDMAVSRVKASYADLAAFAKVGGMTAEEAMEFAADATQVAADSAAYYDRSIEDTMVCMKGLMKGINTYDDNLGFQSTELTRNAKAQEMYANGLVQSAKYAELSSAEQNKVTLEMIRDANKAMGAEGQAVRESQQWANQLGNLTARMKELKAAIGRGFLKPAILGLQMASRVLTTFTRRLEKVTGVGTKLDEFFSDDAMVKYGEKLLPMVESATEKVIDVFEKFWKTVKDTFGGIDLNGILKTTFDVIKKGIGIVNDIADSMGGWENIIGLIVMYASSSLISGWLKGIGSAAEKMLTAFSQPLSPTTWIFIALLAIQDLYAFMEGADNSVIGAIFEHFGVSADDARDRISNAFQTIKDTIGGAIEWVKNTVKGITGGIDLGAVGSGILDALAPLFQRLPEMFDSLKQLGENLAPVFDHVKDIIGGAFDAVSNIDISGIVDKLSEFASNTLQTIAEHGPSVVDSLVGIAEAIGQIVSVAGDMIGTGFDIVGTLLNAGDGAVIETAVSAFDGLVGVIEKVVGFVGDHADVFVPLVAGIMTAKGAIGAFSAIKGVLGPVAEAFDAFGPGLELLQFLFPSVDKAVVAFTGAFGGIKPILSTVGGAFGKVLPLFSSIGTFITGTAVPAVVSFISAAAGIVAPFLPFIAIAAAVVGAGVLIYQNWDTIKEKAGELKDWISEKFQGLKDAICGAIDGFKEKFPAAFEFIKGVFDGWWSTISGVIDGVKQAFQGVTEFVSGVFKGDWSQALDGLKNIFKGAFNSLKSLALAPLNGLKGVVKGAFNAINTATGGKLDELKNKASEAWNGVKDAAGTALQAAKDTVSEKLGNIKSAYDENGGGIKGAAAAAVEGVKGYYTTGLTFVDKLTGGKLSSVKDKFSSKLGEVKDNVSEAFGNVKDTVGSLMETAKTNVSEKLDNIKTAYDEAGGGIQGVISGAMTGVKDEFEGGLELANTLTGGKFGEILGKIQEFASPAIESVKNTWTTIKDNAGELVSNMISTVGTKLSEITTVVENGFQGAIDFIKSLPEKALTWGGDFIDGLANGIRNKLGGIKDAVGGITKHISGALHFSKPDFGPLREYEKWMPDMMSGMAKSLKSGAGEFYGGIKTVASTASEMLQGGISAQSNIYSSNDAKAASEASSGSTRANSDNSIGQGVIAGIKSMATAAKQMTATVAANYGQQIQEFGNAVSVMMAAQTPSVATTRTSNVNNARSYTINQTNEFNNSFRGGERETQKNVAKAIRHSAIDSTTEMANALRFARG